MLVLLAVLLLVLMVLDAMGKINLMHPLPMTVLLLTIPNGVLWGSWIYGTDAVTWSSGTRVGALVLSGIFAFYILARLSLFPFRDGHKAPVRCKIMVGGRTLVHRALWGMVLQVPFYLASYPRFLAAGIPDSVLVANAIVCAVVLFALLVNGILRIFFTSRRLSLVRRAVMLLTMWIPVVNLIVLLYACRIVYEEYDFSVNKESVRQTRVDSDICETKYPLIMVHGVLFRDLRYFNYWGRIPKELTRYGATIYYGNQEAVGTIETNAEDIRKKIEEVLEETGSEKVNIIAHSKGGLDSRYAISMLGVEDKVASLTTVGTPHRGCRVVDVLCKMPESWFRLLAKPFDGTFRKLGDKNPDFYTAIHQFTTGNSAAFNDKVKDVQGVYYQSYMNKMRGFFSDSLLWFPYCIIKLLEGPNDGLVAIPSAIWGEYRGLMTSKGRRGISHGDIIDLKREDYRGFDVVEAYVGIVSELKEMGY